jgi:hypothetical protein
MACGSCGGARARAQTVVGPDGQQRIASPRRTKYVAKWIPSAGGDPKVFDSQREAEIWVKDGNPGSIMIEPAV